MKITMAKKELQRMTVIEQLKNRILTSAAAAVQLGISTRQVFRSLSRYRKDGQEGLVHKRRGQLSNRRLKDSIRERILSLLRDKYSGFGPTFAAEKLQELDGIKVSRECLRKLMIANSFWHKKRKRRSGRKWRPRKEYFGELVQCDGSEHRWFHGIDQLFTLIAFIDDATSRLLYAALYPSESTECVMHATKYYALKYGLPVAIYTDRGGVFKVNVNNQNDDRLTQYEYALKSLDVKLIHAYSPQAKGRIERSFGTLQDRLVKELKLASITSIDEANKFIQNVFIPDYNKRFSVPPTHSINLHRQVSDGDLDSALCRTYERIVNNDWTVKYKNKTLQLDHTRPAIVKPKDCILIHQKLSGELYVTIRKETIAFEDITNKKREQQPKLVIDRQPHKPAEDHPWRRWSPVSKKSVYASQL